MPTALILYIPVLHQGYLSLLQTWSGKVDTLYIIGPDIIADFPRVAREIRAITPNVMQQIILNMKLFPKVEVLTKAQLQTLHDTKVVMANETISLILKRTYLDHQNVAVDFASVFLRWDEQTALSQKPVEYDAEISQANFDRQIMELAHKEANLSWDWFRQVGAALVKDGQIVSFHHNLRLPTPQSAYIEGDPRNYVELGTSTHLHNGLHAEQFAIAEAARKGISLEGASLYVTTFPCPDCAALIAHSGIKQCFFATGYAALDGQTVLKNHGVKIIHIETTPSNVR
jgi:dCMP deaminase